MDTNDNFFYSQIKQLFNQWELHRIQNEIQEREQNDIKKKLYDAVHDEKLRPFIDTAREKFLQIDNLIKKSKNTDFEAVKPTKEENKMPPKYSDGSLRAKRNGFEYRFMHEREQHSVYGKTEQECFNKRTDIITGKSKQKTSQQYTFGEWLVKWYAAYKIRKDGSKINSANEKYIQTQIIPSLGKVPLKSLTGLQIQEFLKQYDDRTNTRAKLAKLIKASLDIAAADNIIKRNPFLAVRIENHRSKSYNVIQPAEQNLLLQKIDNPKYLALFWFCCCSGLRISEAIASIPHIDFENNIIKVQGEDTATKKHRRQIPFLPGLIDNEQKQLLLTVTANGAKIYFNKLFKKLNLDFVIHSFRHTFISCCYHVGFKDKQIQEWAGHSSIKMTMDTYTHILTNENSPILDYLRRLKDKLGL